MHEIKRVCAAVIATPWIREDHNAIDASLLSVGCDSQKIVKTPQSGGLR